MPKFKVGDKVTIDSCPEYGVLTITGVDDHFYCYEFDSGGAWEDEGLTLVESVDATVKINSDGGPTAYYDFLPDWKTWNDLADFKAKNQWKEHSFHLGNVGKAIYRWGEKTGTSLSYDAKKIVYSGLRVLLMLDGKEAVRNYLKDLLEDEQFD